MKKAKESTAYYLCLNEAGKPIAAGTAYSIFNDLNKSQYFETLDLQKYSHIGFINAVKTATQSGWSRKVGINRSNGRGLETFLGFEPITAEQMQQILDGKPLEEVEV